MTVFTCCFSPNNASPPKRPVTDKKTFTASDINGGISIRRFGAYKFGFENKLEENYEVSEEILGRGSQGVVYSATKRETGEKVAVKSILKSTLVTDEEKRDLRMEVDVLNRIGIGSLNCISLYDTFEDDNNIYLVMELATGGTLIDRLEQCERYSEKQVCRVARSVLQTIAQCHAKNVIYRDVKMENFVYKDKSEEAVLKAIDFGLAVHHPPGTANLTDTTGTPYFMAPEVVSQNYSFQCDLWSCGVLVYMLLCGQRPFEGDPKLGGINHTYSVLDAIVKNQVKMSGKVWQGISPEARDFVNGLLQKNPEKRMNVDSALDHPWLGMITARVDSKLLSNSIVARLQRYSTYGPFKQKAMVHIIRNNFSNGDGPPPENQSKAGKYFADFINEDQKLHELMKYFSQLDVDSSGGITNEEAEMGLYKSGYQLSQEETRTLWKTCDINSDGEVDTDEFITALLDWNELEVQMKERGVSYDDIIIDVFKHFDQDGSGTLQVEELASVLDKGFKSPEVRALLDLADKDGNGSIDFEEFRQIMCSNEKDNLKIYDARIRTGFENKDGTLVETSPVTGNEITVEMTT